MFTDDKPTVFEVVDQELASLLQNFRMTWNNRVFFSNNDQYVGKTRKMTQMMKILYTFLCDFCV